MSIQVSTTREATLPLSAAEKANDSAKKETPEKAASKPPEKTNAAVPFHGTLTAKTDASITLKERTFEVTSETKITKDGKPATLADGEIGKTVTGQYRKLDGKLVAKLIRVGGKPEAPEKAKVEKVKKDKPETKPVAKPEVKPETLPVK